jgi:hypothetical protein
VIKSARVNEETIIPLLEAVKINRFETTVKKTEKRKKGSHSVE